MTTVAVLGLGSIGLRHARNLIELGANVVGFDPDVERQALLKEVSGTLVNSRESALVHADAIIIASPNRFHRDDLGAAIKAGRHVFIEKPLTHDSAGVAKILSAAERKDRVVFAGLNTRFNPAVQRARNLLRENAIGRVYWGRFISASYLPSWRSWQDHKSGYAADPLTGGVLFDAIHEFDLAWFLFGPGQTVAAAANSSGTLGIKADDCADAILRHENGVQSNIHLDYLTRPRRRCFEIAGENGIIEVDVAARSLLFHGPNGDVRLNERFDSTVDVEYKEEIRSFLACIRGEETPICNGREALAVLEQVIAARRLSGLPNS